MVFVKYFFIILAVRKAVRRKDGTGLRFPVFGSVGPDPGRVLVRLHGSEKGNQGRLAEKLLLQRIKIYLQKT